MQPLVPHPTSEDRHHVLLFYLFHILKTIRNNRLNLKNENTVFIYPSIEDFYPTHSSFLLTIQNASFNDLRINSGLEKNHDLFDLNQIFSFVSEFPYVSNLFFNIFSSLYLSLTNSLLLN